MSLPIGSGRAQLTSLLDGLGDGDGRLIVVLPSWLDDKGRQGIEVVRSALHARREVVRFETALPPLAARVLGALAASLAPLAPSTGVLIDGLRTLQDELIVAAGVPSVWRLPNPRPSFGQRLQSALPGSRFVVRAQPDPSVTAVRKDGDLPALLMDADPAATGVVVAGKGDNWLAGALARAFGGVSVTRVEPVGELARAWGTSQAVEAVAYPLDREQLAADLFAHPGVPCPWCGEPVTAVPCPVCGHDRNRQLQEGLH